MPRNDNDDKSIMSLFQLALTSVPDPAKLIAELPASYAVSIYNAFSSSHPRPLQEPSSSSDGGGGGGRRAIIFFAISDRLRVRYELPRSMLLVTTARKMREAAKRIRKVCEKWDAEMQTWRVITVRELILEMCLYDDFSQPESSSSSVARSHFPRVSPHRRVHFIEVDRHGLLLVDAMTHEHHHAFAVGGGGLLDSLRIQLALDEDGAHFAFSLHPGGACSSRSMMMESKEGRYVGTRPVREYLRYNHDTQLMQSKCTCRMLRRVYEVFVGGPDAPPTIIYSMSPRQNALLSFKRCPVHRVFS